MRYRCERDRSTIVVVRTVHTAKSPNYHSRSQVNTGTAWQTSILNSMGAGCRAIARGDKWQFTFSRRLQQSQIQSLLLGVDPPFFENRFPIFRVNIFTK